LVLNISVSDLYQADHGYQFTDSILGLADCISLGALVFEKLNRIEEAWLVALHGSLTCLRATSRCQCNLVLGRIYAKAAINPLQYPFLLPKKINHDDDDLSNNNNDDDSDNNEQLCEQFFLKSEQLFSVSLLEAKRSRLPVFEIYVVKQYESFFISLYGDSFDVSRMKVLNNIVDSALKRLGKDWTEFEPYFNSYTQIK